VFFLWPDENNVAVWFDVKVTSVILRNFLSSRYTQSGETVSLLTVPYTKFTESKLSDLDDISVMSLLVAGNDS
jgi:hypothetical protein